MEGRSVGPCATRYIEEYELADLLVVLSTKAAETFRIQGFPEEKLFYLPRGVDVERFKPGTGPPMFRAVFSGALIERKGIHHLLEAWHRLDLKNAELWLVGSVHEEAKPSLKKFWRDNITVVGFTSDVAKYLSQSTVHIFPSQLEGSAKVTYEAAACGLPQITTREAGDVVNDGVEGLIVPPADVDALAVCDSAFVSTPGNCRTNGHRRAGESRKQFYVGPFPHALTWRLRASDEDKALMLLLAIYARSRNPPAQREVFAFPFPS